MSGHGRWEGGGERVGGLACTLFLLKHCVYFSRFGGGACALAHARTRENALYSDYLFVRVRHVPQEPPPHPGLLVFYIGLPISCYGGGGGSCLVVGVSVGSYLVIDFLVNTEANTDTNADLCRKKRLKSILLKNR